ncbi:MAG: FxsA family protein, partial [Candidatus Riflebacteria bacterium]
MGCVFYFFLIVAFFSISEVSLLLYVAQHTGLVFTMACCVFTGLLGGYLVRQQGIATLAKIRRALEMGELPADEAIEAVILFTVGILLCVPGFITDTMGFLMVVPAIRKMVARSLIDQFKQQIANGNVKIVHPFSSAQPSPPNS